MSRDYRLRENLQRIIKNAGETPHWNTARDSLDLPQTFTRTEVEAAVKRAIEACAEACDDSHRGNLPKHIQSADGVLLRKMLAKPEAIAKIMEGDA